MLLQKVLDVKKNIITTLYTHSIATVSRIKIIINRYLVKVASNHRQKLGSGTAPILHFIQILAARYYGT